MKKVDLVNLERLHGNVKIGEIINTMNLPYTCPKCSGAGFNEKTYDAYPEGLPDSGWAQDMKVKLLECELCKGHGFTEKQYLPDIKVEVIGYKEAFNPYE